MTTSTAETVVRAFFDSLNTGDLERLRPFLTPQTVWMPMVRGMTSAEHYRGNAIIDEFLKPIRGPDGLFAPGDPKVALTALVAQGDKVAAETAGTGFLRDGRRYENSYAWFFVVSGNTLASIHEYMDSRHVSQLLQAGEPGQ